MERKNLDCILQVEEIDEKGAFSGYASIFGVVDSHHDVILPGAFKDSVKAHQEGRKIRLLWQHHADEPIGVITEIKEDKTGLYVEGHLLMDVRRAKEAYALLGSNAISGLSIGFTVVDADFDASSGARIIKQIAGQM